MAEFAEKLVSPKGNEYTATSPVEANDLKAQGYVPAEDVKKTTRKRKSTEDTDE